MNLFPMLKNAPIVEAILDVQIIFPQPPQLEIFSELHQQFANEFPIKRDERSLEFGYQATPGKPASAISKDHGVIGYRYLSQDEKRVVQFRRNGFTFNQIEPYTNWDDLIGRAEPIWKSFRNVFSNAIITRIAVRNINRIMIPPAQGEFELCEFFTTPNPGPTIEGLKPIGFMTHGVFLEQSSGFEVNWMLTKQPTDDRMSIPIILDTDVYDRSASVRDADPVEVWNKMRHLKNQLFFSSFTPKGIALFQ